MVTCSQQKEVVSVPLRGLWFLSQSVTTVIVCEVISFRPLAGIMVLIGTKQMAEAWLAHGSFRPLAGIMVLIRTLTT